MFEIEPFVRKAIEDNFADFFDFRQSNAKLGFIKLLKDKTQLGLKEAKEQTDIIFTSDISRFEREFSIRNNRREKLKNIKKTLFAEKLVSIIKEKSDEELYNSLMTIETSEELESLLNLFL